MQTRLGVRDFSMLIALVAIAVFFHFRSDAFISPRNLSQLSIELATTAVLGLGMLLIILPGHIDLSAGSGLGLIGAVAAVLVFKQHWGAPTAMALAVAISVLLYLGMGALIVLERIPAFIITLGGMLVFRGLDLLVIQNQTIPVTHGGQENLYSTLTAHRIDPTAGWILAAVVMLVLSTIKLIGHRNRRARGSEAESGELVFLKLFIVAQLVALFVLFMNQHRGVPLPAVLIAVVALFVHGLTQHTRFGRYLYAIGGNPEAAVVSGVPTRAVVIGAFGIMGVVVALAGFLQSAYTGSATTTTGEWMELDAIAACVIGGASLRGGRGTVVGVLFGALIMATLLNGMTLMEVEQEKKLVARGVVLALAVWMDVRLSRRGSTTLG